MHLFSFLRAISGESISIAQMIFAGLYVANQGLVMTLYIRTMALPPWGLLLFCISRRLHSIFVLRLFNDCWAMFFAYAAMLVVQSRRYRSAIILFSLAVSVKMNVLLMAPGVVAVMIKVYLGNISWCSFFPSFHACIQLPKEPNDEIYLNDGRDTGRYDAPWG